MTPPRGGAQASSWREAPTEEGVNMALIDRWLSEEDGRAVLPRRPFSGEASLSRPLYGLTRGSLTQVFRSESWGGSLILSEFERVLDKLGLDGRTLGKRLFDAFDRDGNRQLDFREMFIGMSLLLSGSREERLESAFMMMDSNGSGRVSRDEMEVPTVCLLSS